MTGVRVGRGRQQPGRETGVWGGGWKGMRFHRSSEWNRRRMLTGCEYRSRKGRSDESAFQVVEVDLLFHRVLFPPIATRLIPSPTVAVRCGVGVGGGGFSEVRGWGRGLSRRFRSLIRQFFFSMDTNLSFVEWRSFKRHPAPAASLAPVGPAVRRADGRQGPICFLSGAV